MERLVAQDCGKLVVRDRVSEDDPAVVGARRPGEQERPGRGVLVAPRRMGDMMGSKQRRIAIPQVDDEER